MNLNGSRRTWAVARKEFIHVLRDPLSLGMAIAMPMILLILFGFALTLDVDRVPVVVWDQSQTQASRDLIGQFAGSRYFAVQSNAWSYRQLEDEIDRGRALAALVVPRDFAERLAAGRPAPVQLIIDDSDSNTATIALGYAQAVSGGYSQQVMIDQAGRQVGSRAGRTISPPLDVRQRVWFNSDLESRNFIIPGLIAVIMMVIAALLTSLTVAREWERGTMEQLVSTPVRGVELITGKLIPYFVVGMVDVTIVVLMGQFLFHIPLRGSVPLLFAMSAIFLVGALSLGLLISVVIRQQVAASQIALVATFLPAFLLSGFAFAISNMPPAIQAATYLVPARYFVTLLKAIYLKGVGLEVLWPEAALLTIFTIGAFALAVMKFKRRLD